MMLSLMLIMTSWYSSKDVPLPHLKYTVIGDLGSLALGLTVAVIFHLT